MDFNVRVSLRYFSESWIHKINALCVYKKLVGLMVARSLYLVNALVFNMMAYKLKSTEISLQSVPIAYTFKNILQSLWLDFMLGNMRRITWAIGWFMNLWHLQYKYSRPIVGASKQVSPIQQNVGVLQDNMWIWSVHIWTDDVIHKHHISRPTTIHEAHGLHTIEHRCVVNDVVGS
jgi:hypothetical protein